MRAWLFEWARRLAALGWLALGTLFLVLVALMMCVGGVWAHLLYASRPIADSLVGVGALFVWYLLHRGYRNTAREWLRWGVRMFMLTVSFGLSLAVGEFGLRAYYTARQNTNSMERLKEYRRQGKPMPIHSTHPLASIIQPSEDTRLVYEMQPNLNTDFGHRRVRTNTQGMRGDREYPPDRLPNSARIVGIGDSGMFGWDVEQNQDYMAVLETNLNQRQDGTLYDALNLAVPGYNTQLEVEMLRSKGLKYHPDIVVVGWCENDYSLSFFMLQKEDYRRRDKSYLYHLLFQRGGVHATEVAPGITMHDQREFQKDKVLPELTAGTDSAGVKAALADLKRLSQQADFKVLVFGPMQPLICQLCTEVGIPYASTHDLIPDNKYPSKYLVHYMHPSPEGHRVLAEYLERELVRRGWLPPLNRIVHAE